MTVLRITVCSVQNVTDKLPEAGGVKNTLHSEENEMIILATYLCTLLAFI